MTRAIGRFVRLGPWAARTVVVLVALRAAASAGAAEIDLSRFNAVALTARVQVTERYTLSNGSTGESTRNGFAFDSSRIGDFARGRFQGNVYTAAWDEKILLPSTGQFWTLNRPGFPGGSIT